tara:strand:- start:18312 stop:20216 length:1905 start_codon:yes stop_codon:yes gene_type:complete
MEKQKENGRNLQEPLFKPESRWTPPKDFPDLSSAKLIAFDCETCDPNLIKHGPGGVRNDGRLVGLSMATDDGFSGYYPIRHEGGGNLDCEQVLRWAKDQLKGQTDKVGANILYDLEWLRSEGIHVGGNKYDIQVAEPLIDEERKEGYSLEVLSRRYLNKGKEEDLLRAAAEAYNINPKSELWKLPAHYVGPYGEMDSVRTLQVFQKQRPIIEEEGLSKVFQLETNLIPLILDMRWKGVKVDLDKAEKLNTKYKKEEIRLLNELKKFAGFPIEPWSNDKLAHVCKLKSIWFPRTEAGNPSFQSGFLENSKETFLRQVYEYRKVNKMRRDFIDAVILGMNVNGRIHAQFHPLRKDDTGTRTGRFSSSSPNLQQIPARDEHWGPLIRSLFIPDEGCDWLRLDYNQQEPRVLVHYAVMRRIRGADLAAEEYKKGDADFHTLVANMAGIDRKVAKTINLGIMYGMGIFKLSQMLNLEYNEAKVLLEQYHVNVPFIKGLMHEASKAVQYRGEIKTLLGRKRHFDYWVPSDSNLKFPHKEIPLRKKDAEEVWPGRPLQRAYTHKALNALIQGSSADLTKTAMLAVYNETGEIPSLQVHDELDFSTSKDNMDKIADIMETCMELNVPLKVSRESGKSWGEVK